MAIKIKDVNRKNFQNMVLYKNLYIAENRLVMKTSPFFYEWVRLNIWRTLINQRGFNDEKIKYIHI